MSSFSRPSMKAPEFKSYLLKIDSLFDRNVKKRKDKRSDIVSKKKPKRLGIVIRSRICLVENRLFRSGPESALLDQMCSFDGADSGRNSDVLVSFLFDVGTFVERLLLYCFDITTIRVKNWTLS